MEQKGAAGLKQSGEQGLEQLLQLAVRQPRHVNSEDGGALLALCVHCAHQQSSCFKCPLLHIWSSVHSPRFSRQLCLDCRTPLAAGSGHELP